MALPRYLPQAVLLALLAALLLCGAVTPDSFAASGAYRGNQKTRVFHVETCRHYNCKNCVIRFASYTAAVNAGFRPCKLCLGG